MHRRQRRCPGRAGGFSVDNIRALRAEDPETPLILIRQDTVPEDIKEISMADGLLTARGANLPRLGGCDPA